jgi:1,4-alpha-glucan branching enzyme
MRERENNGLPPELRDATRILRETPQPNDLWRQRLLREIEAAPRPRAEGRAPVGVQRWSMRPLTAVAAGLVCVLVGGAAVASVMDRQPPISKVQPPTADRRIRFTLVAPTASTVSIVGDFNGWNPTSLPLRRSADGRTWEVEVPLAPGRYAYSFVVDGALARDPAAPQALDGDLGTTNSVVMVRGS